MPTRDALTRLPGATSCARLPRADRPGILHMPELSGMLLLVVVLALLFDFSNGWHDSANAIATVVSTRVLSPAVAVLMAGVLNVAGAFTYARCWKP